MMKQEDKQFLVELAKELNTQIYNVQIQKSTMIF
jgi:hypothetical protein